MLNLIAKRASVLQNMRISWEKPPQTTKLKTKKLTKCNHFTILFI